MKELKVDSENGLPRCFQWRGQRYQVQAVLERWKDSGRWWEGEAPKLFFRVRTDGGGLWEICRDTVHRKWYLYKIYD